MRPTSMSHCFAYRLSSQVVCLDILLLFHYAEVAVDLIHVISHLIIYCLIIFSVPEDVNVDQTHQLWIANILRINVDHTMKIHHLMW